MSKNSFRITLTEDGNAPTEEFAANESHYLQAFVDGKIQDIYLDFSSRLAMYEFALALMHESLYGEFGMQERSPMVWEGKQAVQDGVRLSPESSRLFVLYNRSTPSGAISIATSRPITESVRPI